MRSAYIRAAVLSVLICSAILSFTGCGYNSIQSADETVKAAWSDVLNQYQRRADLIPNLVNAVKGYAAHERGVFQEVTDARSRVGQLSVNVDSASDPVAVAQFQDAQRSLSGALSRLIAVAENYPQLKADANFRDLQAQIEGTENRITVARNRYIESVQRFNTIVRSFPSNLTAKVFGYPPRPTFTVDNEREISRPPTVDFTPGAR